MYGKNITSFVPFIFLQHDSFGGVPSSSGALHLTLLTYSKALILNLCPKICGTRDILPAELRVGVEKYCTICYLTTEKWLEPVWPIRLSFFTFPDSVNRNSLCDSHLKEILQQKTQYWWSFSLEELFLPRWYLCNVFLVSQQFDLFSKTA